ncbi:MAG: hypothetical protein EB168_08745 [Euryarchaeota archaeon]|jgi:hypothetical protein|nr:hypothetical protein [Euryarchaeota archaeon]
MTAEKKLAEPTESYHTRELLDKNLGIKLCSRCRSRIPHNQPAVRGQRGTGLCYKCWNISYDREEFL